MTNSLPRLFMPGLPHTVTHPDWSHCAFTNKVRLWAPMMRSVGYDVTIVGVEGMKTRATREIAIMTQDEQAMLCDGYRYDPHNPKFVGDFANIGNPLYQEFNRRLNVRLRTEMTEPSDILCLPFGHAHGSATEGLRRPIVETGVGYPTLFGDCPKVFETESWRHWHYGKGVAQSDYHWVIPNYFDPAEWEVTARPTDGYWLYFGRVSAIKGMREIVAIARHRPDLRIVVCGQHGEEDPKQYTDQAPNLEYRNPICGSERSALYAGAIGVLMPTRYIEPFGGVTVEAQLCGRPVLGSAFGSFTETIRNGVTGFQCRTLGDFLGAIERVEEAVATNSDQFRPEHIRSITEHHYSMYQLAHTYHNVLEHVDGLRFPKQRDWYRLYGVHGVVTKAVRPPEPPVLPVAPTPAVTIDPVSGQPEQALPTPVEGVVDLTKMRPAGGGQGLHPMALMHMLTKSQPVLPAA